ncbi:ABC transporter permease subunit [Nakamurella sp. YIM 132087]|uniref:ABC transporter permease subunit n=1 Tax=Nakamurella alba TaxID=2665158 RepID=A0A7K1FK14_9ACTN|nr:sugar ABC transporter permease [Nakamurella alba]MTD14426.1 ABC transporter permease subunit [Nakamurella alba]
MTTLQKAPADSGPSASAVADATRRAKKEAWLRRAPLLPGLIFTIIVTQLPFVVTIVLSFRRWDADRPRLSGWTLRNYQEVFSDSGILSAMWHTVILTVSVVVISLVFGLGIALLLNRTFRGRGAVRTMMIAPFLIVPVAAATFFRYGVFDASNGLLAGIVTSFKRIFDPDAAAATISIAESQPMLTIIITLVWQWTPFMTLILLAGLQSRPGDILEAAAVDGANGWQVFRSLTMPHMRQYLELAGLLGAIYIIQNFDAVFTLTPLNPQTENLPYLIFRTIQADSDYGLASAQGVVVVILTIVIATFALRTVSSLFKEENAR